MNADVDVGELVDRVAELEERVEHLLRRISALEERLPDAADPRTAAARAITAASSRTAARARAAGAWVAEHLPELAAGGVADTFAVQAALELGAAQATPATVRARRRELMARIGAPADA